MNKETNDFLLEELNEAHYYFVGIINEMKENNITENYDELETNEIKCYNNIIDLINQMKYSVCETNLLREKNKELFEYEHKLYIKYALLYIVSITFILGYHNIFDTSKISDIVKYLVGMFLGTIYAGLLNKDLNDNRSGTKETRDLINKLKTMKEEYKINHDSVVSKINDIFRLNDRLRDKMDREMIKKI